MKEHRETSIHHIRGSSILLTVRIFICLFLIDTVYAGILLILISNNIEFVDHITLLMVLWIIHTVKFFIIVFFMMGLILPWVSTVYYIGDHHLIKFSGIWRKNEVIFDLYNVRSVSMHENWLGKLLNYGDVNVIISGSGYREEVHIKGITDPKKYERIFREYLNDSLNNISM